MKAYQTDLNLFLDHLSKHKNKLIDIVDLEKLDQSDLTSWFYNRIKIGVSHRSNARSLSSIKSFISFLIIKNIIKYSAFIRMKGPKF